MPGLWCYLKPAGFDRPSGKCTPEALACLDDKLEGIFTLETRDIHTKLSRIVEEVSKQLARLCPEMVQGTRAL